MLLLTWNTIKKLFLSKGLVDQLPNMSCGCENKGDNTQIVIEGLSFEALSALIKPCRFDLTTTIE